MAQDDFKDWIGRSVSRRDLVTERLVEQFKATFTPHLFEAECPPGLHWCLAVPHHPSENLGPDGAEKKGLFIPPIELPLRRWWGGSLQILGNFRIGD
jgi:3-methylfumaryl-CoA hydratase